jgi:hypothetical protein
VFPLGEIRFPLDAITEPEKLLLEIRLGDVAVNHYSLWVYPSHKGELVAPAGVTLSQSLDKKTCEVLSAGGRVVLLPDGKNLASTVRGGFATDFWCWPMFHNKPGTMGILCDPKHPALAGFPTEFHSNWQWANLASHARPLILDATPADFRPIVQVIDNLDRNHKLGMVFEAKVGSGKLLVCSLDDWKSLMDKREARQFIECLVNYAGSDRFQPGKELSLETLQLLLKVSSGKPGPR